MIEADALLILLSLLMLCGLLAVVVLLRDKRPAPETSDNATPVFRVKHRAGPRHSGNVPPGME